MSAHAARNAFRAANAATAKETRIVLPDIIKQLPALSPSNAESFHLDYLPPLKAANCPKHHAPSGKVAVKIVNSDTFNAAIDMAAKAAPDSGRVVVLNMASNTNPGGGWLSGAGAQEEALCYRSSLSLSLHKRFYPIKQRGGLYTGDVVVIRSDMASGHKLLVPEVEAQDLPVVSVISIAGLRRPDVSKTPVPAVSPPTGDAATGGTTAGPSATGGTSMEAPNTRAAASPDQFTLNFAKASDRELTKDKMRLCLRIAATRSHGLLVLGALGCGAFRNPPQEVANCWLEVLREDEFKGGWWKELWFAVFDRKNEGNFEVFERVLGGQEV